MKVLNFGSLNIDYTYRVDHIVAPGETISSKNLEIFPGGKGLNQSIALAKAGAEVYHAGQIGKDGLFLKKICEENGVCVSYIRETDTNTGNAIIQVADSGQNSILLFPGANREQEKTYIDHVLEQFEEGDFLLLQNEINHIDYLIEKGKAKGMVIGFNPSPFDEKILECDLEKVDLFFVNEVEAEQMCQEEIGKGDVERVLQELKEEYPKARFVLTVGAKGAYYSDEEKTYFQKAIKTKVVDTTAAGDTFTGYFISSIIRGEDCKAALIRATAASSLAVGRKGASVSIPVKEEVEEYLQTL